MSGLPEPYICSKKKKKVIWDLSNYATKSDVLNVKVVDTSEFTKKINLANLKSDADELDIDELKNVLSGLSS